jgi:hypothetical protein
MNRTTIVAGLMLGGMGLAATPAFAQPPMGFAGTLSAQYGQWSTSGFTADQWGINGQAAFGLAPQFGAEIDAGYSNLSNHGTLDTWAIGGHAFWAPDMGRLGATVQYQSTSGGGADIHLTNYGAFGEYYASNMFTLGLNAGGYSASAGFGGFGGSSDGGYVGGGVIGYVLPDLSLTGTINYLGASGSNLTSFGIQGEWLFSESLPISGYIGYTYTDISNGGGHVDQWFIGFKYYTDGNGSTLVEKQRNGALDSIVRPAVNLTF